MKQTLTPETMKNLIQETRYQNQSSYKGSFNGSLDLYSIWSHNDKDFTINYWGGSYRQMSNKDDLNSWLKALNYNTF